MNHCRRYGNYQIIRELGKGGYGEVFLVQDITTSRSYAMKMLDKDKITKENLEEDVLAEVRSMKLARHPYIVRLFEVLKTNKKILLLMEYMDGGDLFDAIKAEKEARMSESKARRYFQQIVLAVKYLHKKNIIHRDLKPENILIDKKNNCIKITDFGLSTLINRKDQVLHDIAGTTDYLAPEVIKQTGYLGQSADIWSCGVILYNCITGNKPFTGANSVMLNNILTGNAEYGYNRLPKNLIDLFKQIFDPNPATRYTIDQIMEHEWFKEGFDEVKNTVEQFLSKNKEDDDEAKLQTNNKTIQCITTVYLNQKDISFNLEEIPLVTCFELALICYGKTVSNMFNNGSSKGMFCDMKCFKFICRKGHEFGCGLLKDYLAEIASDCEFSKVDHDQIILNVLYKDSIVCMKLQIVKVSKDGKCIFVISYQNGIVNDYFKIMKGFFYKNKALIDKC